MIRRAFEHRSGRVIALSRVVMAIAFIVAAWLDQDQPSRDYRAGYVLLSSYVAFAVAMVLVVWRNWWLDHRLSEPSFVVDVIVFLAAVYVTENADSDFVSPFMAFFAFLLLTATIRWRWQRTAVAAVVVSATYIALGIFLSATDDVDMLRYERRLIYMVILALFIVWFGLQQRNFQPDRLQDTVDLDRARLFDRILNYATEQTRSSGGGLIWTPDEEPWSELYASGSLGRLGERLAPHDPLAEEPVIDHAILFDVPHGRALCLAGERVVSRKDGFPRGLVDRFGVESGLLLPLHAATGNGMIVLTGIDGMCSDDLELGEAIAHEIGAALDRHQMALMLHESAIAGVRSSVARDLHDSVAQSLAGACFRLQTLRSAVRDGPAEREIAEVHDALRAEQHHVRRMISQLRNAAEPDLSSDLQTELAQTLDDTARHWGIEARFLPAPEKIRVSTRLLHEVQQLVREAVANAVRHGKASNVEVTVCLDGSNLLALAIADDGKGFELDGGLKQPRSIAERVAALGGNLAVESRSGRTLLDIRVPAPGKL